MLCPSFYPGQIGLGSIFVHKLRYLMGKTTPQA